MIIPYLYVLSQKSAIEVRRSYSPLFSPAKKTMGEILDYIHLKLKFKVNSNLSEFYVNLTSFGSESTEIFSKISETLGMSMGPKIYLFPE
jgi:hypothetical protein